MAKILFLQSGLNESMAAMQLSAVLKSAGHRCEAAIASPAPPLEEIARFQPDIIGMTVMTPQRAWAASAARALKAAGVKALLAAGGPHPTFFPEYLEQTDFDLVNIGEGEGSLLELADKLSAGQDWRGIRNIHCKDGGAVVKNPLRPLADINALPDPDREIYFRFPQYLKQGGYYAYTSKGCPFSCKFCFIPQFKQVYREDPLRSRLRLKSVDRCMAELASMREKMPVKFITFLDSTFNGDKAWTLEFLGRYGREIRIPFTINLRAELADEAVVSAIAATGCCDHIRLGVETGDQELRRNLLGKQTTDAALLELARLLKKHKIKFLTYNMFGLPGETLEQAAKTVELNLKMRPDFFVPLVFQALPGLEITKEAAAAGYIDEAGLAKPDSGVNEMLESRLRQPDIVPALNLCKLSIISVRLPRLAPLVRRLAKLPRNPVFDALFVLLFSAQARRMYRLSLAGAVGFMLDYFSLRSRK
ncbi:MAG: radical SAM protein [Elusimicrobiales bacterium]